MWEAGESGEHPWSIAAKAAAPAYPQHKLGLAGLVGPCQRGGLDMVWLKQCKRCGGDLHENKDIHGYYIACLQCGRVLTREEESSLLLYRCWPTSKKIRP